MQRGEAKRNLPWSILEDSQCQPLLENFLELKLCILYFVSKLRKSAIQRFKWCTIQSWNEGVRAIGSRSHQAEGQFRRAAKSAFGYEITRGGLRNQPMAAKWCPSCCEISQTSCMAAKFSWNFLIFATDILRYFALDIWCQNPQTLLVIHLS